MRHAERYRYNDPPSESPEMNHSNPLSAHTASSSSTSAVENASRKPCSLRFPSPTASDRSRKSAVSRGAKAKDET
jgi:hypothetical protein